MKRKNSNYAALAASLPGQTIDITVNTRPKATERKGMKVVSIKGNGLTAATAEGEEFNYTFGEHNMDEQEDGTICLYDMEAPKPSVLVVLRKAG